MQVGFGHGRDERQRDSEEALHVTGAPAVQPSVCFLQGERIARPRLIVDGDAVGVPAEHDTAFDVRTDPCQQVRLAAVGVLDSRVGDAVLVEQALGQGDQLQVRLAAGGVQRHEPLEQLEGPRHLGSDDRWGRQERRCQNALSSTARSCAGDAGSSSGAPCISGCLLT